MKLARENVHEKDKYISFEEKEHIYTIKGDSSFTSVTTWIHSHFGHFDADAVIRGIKRKKNYKESKYFNKTDEEIKKEWEDNRNSCAEAGTKLHYDIECYYNDEPQENNSIEYGYFIDFTKKYPDLSAFRTEWMIYDEELKLAGSIDMVYKNKEDNTYMIYDWKRSKEIKKTSWNKYSKTECIEHIPDANYWHYALQLNMYKALLEKNYNINISELFIVCFHPNHKSYLMYKLPILKDEIEQLLELRKTQIN